jgi:hypothetical protein
MEIEKRKVYIQSYEFTMLGFLINEDEFEVSPAVSRVLQVAEFSTNNNSKRKVKKENEEINNFYFVYDIDDYTKSFVINYTTDITITKVENVSSYDVFINDDYYGSDLTSLQINTNDNLRVDITKTNSMKESTITFSSNLI